MSHQADYSVLDQPEVLSILFYPRRDWTPCPPGARDYLVPVERDVRISCRFFPARKDSPCVLFFHGNGEVASDYNYVAPTYKQLGVNLFVADYRGYGRSGRLPAFSSMVKDAHAIFNFFLETLRLQEYAGPYYLMGRSLGTASVLEIAFHFQEQFSGLIVESGSANMIRVLRYHGFNAEPDLTKNLEEVLSTAVRSITLPLLIMHGEHDTLIPPEEATSLYETIGSQKKKLVIIPAVGHNDIMVSGMNQYFSAIREFIFRPKDKRSRAASE